MKDTDADSKDNLNFLFSIIEICLNRKFFIFFSTLFFALLGLGNNFMSQTKYEVKIFYKWVYDSPLTNLNCRADSLCIKDARNRSFSYDFFSSWEIWENQAFKTITLDSPVRTELLKSIEDEIERITKKIEEEAIVTLETANSLPKETYNTDTIGKLIFDSKRVLKLASENVKPIVLNKKFRSKIINPNATQIVLIFAVCGFVLSLVGIFLAEQYARFKQTKISEI